MFTKPRHSYHCQGLVTWAQALSPGELQESALIVNKSTNQPYQTYPRKSIKCFVVFRCTYVPTATSKIVFISHLPNNLCLLQHHPPFNSCSRVAWSHYHDSILLLFPCPIFTHNFYLTDIPYLKCPISLLTSFAKFICLGVPHPHSLTAKDCLPLQDTRSSTPVTCHIKVQNLKYIRKKKIKIETLAGENQGLTKRIRQDFLPWLSSTRQFRSQRTDHSFPVGNQIPTLHGS